MEDMLRYLKGLRPKNKIGAAFGSYGWSGQAAQEIANIMKDTKIDVLDELIKIKYLPKPEELDFKEIIDKLIEKMG